MSTGAKIGIWLGVIIALSALGYVIYRIIKNANDSNCADGYNFVNGICVPTGTVVNNNGTDGGNTGGGFNNNGGTTTPPVSTPLTIGDKLTATGDVSAYENSLLAGSPYLIKKFKKGNYVGQITGQNSVEWIVTNYNYECNTGDSYNYSSSSSNSHCIKHPYTMYISKSGYIKRTA